MLRLQSPSPKTLTHKSTHLTPQRRPPAQVIPQRCRVLLEHLHYQKNVWWTLSRRRRQLTKWPWGSVLETRQTGVAWLRKKSYSTETMPLSSTNLPTDNEGFFGVPLSSPTTSSGCYCGFTDVFVCVNKFLDGVDRLYWILAVHSLTLSIFPSQSINSTFNSCCSRVSCCKQERSDYELPFCF